MDLKQNLEEIEKNIEAACKKAGRSRDEVTLIAVSKTKPIEMLKEVYDLNYRDFGENYVQELVDKVPQMPEDTKWHMIGHLQRNKVKYIVDKVSMIHSVDSYRLAEEINIQAKKKNITVPILVEVNIAQEESKFGISHDDAMELVEDISTLENVKIMGLMLIAPYVENPEDNRVHFKAMKDLSVDIANKNIHNVTMNVLSMGMSGDYQVAIEEGSTMVRIGTNIFGARDYSKK